jgi:ferredoxin-NADP reductase
MAEHTQPAEVIRVTDLTPHVRQLVLSPLEHRISYLPGQWVSLKLPVGHKPPLNRAYSMAEPESPFGDLTLVLDRVPDGVGSNYLFSLKTGERIPLSGPYGKFVLPELKGKRLLMIGRYTGIVPIRCMVQTLITGNDSTPLIVIAAAPEERELLYHEEFQTLASTHPRLQYHSNIPESGAAQDPGAEVIRTMELVQKLLGRDRDFIPMICGIRDFVRPLRASFMELGLERKEVRIETYD